MGDRKIKRGIYILCFSLVFIFVLSMVSAGVFKDWITGKAQTQNAVLNITVTGGRAPIIMGVYNNTMTDISSGTTEGPSLTYVTIVFNASDADGVGNINNATAKINFSKTGEATRQNTSCLPVTGQTSPLSMNFTCNITMWWFDGPGIWDISAYITDLSSNTAYNNTVKNFTIGATNGLLANQTTINWSAINPGATAQEAQQIMGLNNTGNQQKSVYVNSSDLRGDTNAAYALGANNFSVKNAAGCGGTAMVNRTDTNVTSVQLPRGNYTWNNGTAMANLYFCLESSNANLISQSYSTGPAGSGAWIIKLGS
jgi:hypothetical protein